MKGSGRIATIAAAALALYVLAIWALDWLRVDRTFVQFADSMLHRSDVVIRRRHVETLHGDASALWEIEFEPALALPKDRFGLAQATDREYFRRRVRSAWPDVAAMDGYGLYRGDALLGKGSYCHPSACGAYLLLDSSGKHAYLAIYRF